MLTNSNVISVHVPLLPETRHLINKESIAKMKKNVILVNTSRGEVIHTADLVEGLKSGKIFGAALDVFEGEKAFIFKVLLKNSIIEPYFKRMILIKQSDILTGHVREGLQESP